MMSFSEKNRFFLTTSDDLIYQLKFQGQKFCQKIRNSPGIRNPAVLILFLCLFPWKDFWAIGTSRFLENQILRTPLHAISKSISPLIYLAGYLISKVDFVPTKPHFEPRKQASTTYNPTKSSIFWWTNVRLELNKSRVHDASFTREIRNESNQGHRKEPRQNILTPRANLRTSMVPVCTYSTVGPTVQYGTSPSCCRQVAQLSIDL